jgi:hypothetical protein
MKVTIAVYGAKQGTGLRAVVLEKLPSLNPTIQAQISNAITAIERMAPTFGEAITASPATVEAARGHSRDPTDARDTGASTGAMTCVAAPLCGSSCVYNFST